MSKKTKESEIGQVIKGLKIDVDRTAIEKELQARLERKEARIVELESLVDQAVAKEGQRVEREKWEREEQQRKNEASLRAQPSGGGKVRLPTESTGKYSYGGNDPYRTAIDDLYEKTAQGDKEAEYKLEGLWKLIDPQLKRLAREGMVISGCPRCNSGLIKGTDKCPKCSFDLKESGYKDFGELW